MFDLKAAREQWKRSLRGKCSPEDLQELDTHLEALIDDLVDTGLSEEEAFRQAARRIGAAEDIEREFAKVGSWGEWALERLGVLDRPLLLGLAVICATGMAMLYSAVHGAGADTSSPGLFARHALWMGLGLLLMLTVAQVAPARLQRHAPWIYAVSILSLLLVLTLGAPVNGARRWIVLNGISVQPSVLTLLAVPMMTASLLARREWAQSRRGFAAMLALIALPAVLIALQPDFTMALLCLGAGWITLLASDCRARLVRFTCLALPAAGIGAWLLLAPYRFRRVYSWLNPEADPLGDGWLPLRLQEVVSSGGLLGRGWMNAEGNVPERHTDFILSLVAEEFGTIGVLALLTCFALVLYRAFLISSRSREYFGRLLGLGFTGLVSVQIAVNAAVVYGLLPTVALPLPLVSYGGTSLVLLLAGFGILAAIHNQERKPDSLAPDSART